MKRNQLWRCHHSDGYRSTSRTRYLALEILYVATRRASSCRYRGSSDYVRCPVFVAPFVRDFIVDILIFFIIEMISILETGFCDEENECIRVGQVIACRVPLLAFIINLHRYEGYRRRSSLLLSLVVFSIFPGRNSGEKLFIMC